MNGLRCSCAVIGVTALMVAVIILLLVLNSIAMSATCGTVLKNIFTVDYSSRRSICLALSLAAPPSVTAAEHGG